jgi:hypothetical protein
LGKIDNIHNLSIQPEPSVKFQLGDFHQELPSTLMLLQANHWSQEELKSAIYADSSQYIKKRDPVIHGHVAIHTQDFTTN